MKVNGFEIAEDQKWETRGGEVATITSVTDDCIHYVTGTELIVARPNGRFKGVDMESRFDLIKPVGAQEPAANEPSALASQVGGSHYKDCAIQPVEFIHKNNLDFFQGNIIKYATRHKNKNGAADLRKAIHYCQLALELQYGEKGVV